MSMDTSKAALTSTPRVALRARVLTLLKEYWTGLTADECARLLKESPLAVRPRFTELKKAELIYDTGFRRKNASGKQAAVWLAA